MLVATPAPHAERRLQAVLDNGSTLGLAGVLLGQWRPGGTVRVRTDGTIAATSPHLTDTLAGTRLFTLPTGDTSALLDLLGTAEIPAQRTPTPPPTAADPEEFEFLAMPPASDPPPHVSPDPAPSERSHETSLELTVLGRLHLYHHHTHGRADLIDALAPKQREILVHLALYPNGARRETLTTAIWPDAPGDRPYNSFHATLSQLRRALRKATNDAITDLAVNHDGHYSLDRNLITVDLWQLQDALHHYRHMSDKSQRLDTLNRVATLYQGDLADGLTAEWLEAPREALRRDVLDALSALIQAIGNDQPERTLNLLEQARQLDPYNEALYRDIVRAQARLGQHAAIPRTLALLTHTLTELDQRPSRDTIALCEFLQRPRPHSHAGRNAAG